MAIHNTDAKKARACQKMALLLVILASAFVFQYRHFPETAFETMLFVAGMIGLYTVILLRIWK